MERQTIIPLEISEILGLICPKFSVSLLIGGEFDSEVILVGVYIVVMGFPPKVANLINCISLVGIITNAPKRQPLTDRPIIDWDLILTMQPLTLLGTITGIYLNTILLEKVIITTLVGGPRRESEDVGRRCRRNFAGGLLLFGTVVVVVDGGGDAASLLNVGGRSVWRRGHSATEDEDGVDGG